MPHLRSTGEFMMSDMAGLLYRKPETDYSQTRQLRYITPPVLQVDFCKALHNGCLVGKSALQQIVVGTPIKKAGIDLVGPFPWTENNNQKIVLMQNIFTKSRVAEPLCLISLFIHSILFVICMGVREHILANTSSVPKINPQIGQVGNIILYLSSFNPNKLLIFSPLFGKQHIIKPVTFQPFINIKCHKSI